MYGIVCLLTSLLNLISIANRLFSAKMADLQIRTKKDFYATSPVYKYVVEKGKKVYIYIVYNPLYVW